MNERLEEVKNFAKQMFADQISIAASNVYTNFPPISLMFKFCLLQCLDTGQGHVKRCIPDNCSNCIVTCSTP